MNERHHLILGGTRGLGFAYATVMSRRGDTIDLVGRDPVQGARAITMLDKARGREHRFYQCDLLDSESRDDLILKLKFKYDSVLIGGPSPPPGAYTDLTNAQLSEGLNVCLRYPLSIYEKTSSFLKKGGDVLVVTSSTVEVPDYRRFFLSSTFRSVLEGMLRNMSEVEGFHGSLLFMRPHVVITPLSIEFGKKLAAEFGFSGARQSLATYFRVNQVPSALEFVDDFLMRNECG